MSATVGNTGPQRSPGLQPFSYAEAAKGRSLPSPALQQSSDPSIKSPTGANDGDQVYVAVKQGVNGAVSPPQLEDPKPSSTASPREADTAKSMSDHDGTSTSASTVTSPVLQTPHQNEGNPAQSGTSSPSYGTASTSTLPKEDEISITPNGSSESTWDKQSQVSNSAEKSTQTAEGNAEGGSDVPWGEQGPAATSEFVHAPPPSVNIWTQRREALNAKAKVTPKPAPPPLSLGNPTKSGLNGVHPTGDDPTPDQAKGASKKRNSMPTKGADDTTNLRQDRRKTSEGNKPRDEAPRRSGFRAGRSPDKEKAAPEATAPPPVGDAESWPTPDFVQDSGKRKPSEKVEKSDAVEKDRSPGTRPHGNPKWVPVPYVPTAVFTTPLPQNARRGGRPGGRGGREGRGGHAPSNSVGGDKAAPGAMGPPPTPKSASNERGRTESTGSRAASLPAQSRRATSADAAENGDQRKVSQPIPSERVRGDARPPRNTEESVPKSADAARFPNNVSEETSYKIRSESSSFSRNGENQTSGSNERAPYSRSRHPSLPNDGHSHPSRYVSGERQRTDGFIRPSDFHREPSGGSYPRERGEPRSDRGRGGFRSGRGNYAESNNRASHNFSNQPPPQQSQPPYTPSKSHSYNERSYPDRSTQQAQSATYGNLSQQARNQRPSIRSQSIPNGGPYAAYPNGAAVPPLQTGIPNQYAYSPMYNGMVEAMPYQNFLAEYTVMSMVQNQMEYYFSVDNLCKDLFLRKNMDSKGYVPLPIIANFRRIKSLTDNYELVRMVCRNLKSVEYRVTEDGVDRLRKREGWESWIVKMEDRDPAAQNDGPADLPAQMHPQSLPQGYGDGADDVFSPVDAIPPQSGVAMSPASMHGGPFPEYAAPLLPTSPFGYMNGMMQTPMSHATPEFVPNFPPLSTSDGPNRDAVPDQFPDEAIENLMIVVRKPDTLSPSNGVNPSAQAFSPGSQEGQDMEQGSKSIDGKPALSHGADSVQPSLIEDHGLGIKSPGNMDGDSAFRITNGSAPPSFWVDDNDIPVAPLDNDNAHERYSTFRTKALAERESAPPRESTQGMGVLFNFWSHFLVSNFNSRMYQEFRTLALEERSVRGSLTGLQDLVRFYNSILNSPLVIPHDLAKDYVDIIKNEPKDENRPAFHRLRSLWRNGAFNLKSRKVIDSILDPDLKAELEK